MNAGENGFTLGNKGTPEARIFPFWRRRATCCLNFNVPERFQKVEMVVSAGGPTVVLIRSASELGLRRGIHEAVEEKRVAPSATAVCESSLRDGAWVETKKSQTFGGCSRNSHMVVRDSIRRCGCVRCCARFYIAPVEVATVKTGRSLRIRLWNGPINSNILALS